MHNLNFTNMRMVFLLTVSPLFASIPELQCTDNSESGNVTLSAEPKFPAVNGTPSVTPKFPDDSNFLPVAPKFPDDLDPLPAAPKFPDDSEPLPVTPKFPDDSDPLPVAPKFPDDSEPLPVAPKFPDDLDMHSVDPNFTVETDSLRDYATSGYVLNVALTELHSAVPMPAALGSPFYDISSQLSLNLLTQDLGFAPVQKPYKPFSFPANPYNPLPFPEEMDTLPFKG